MGLGEGRGEGLGKAWAAAWALDPTCTCTCTRRVGVVWGHLEQSLRKVATPPNHPRAAGLEQARPRLRHRPPCPLNAIALRTNAAGMATTQ